MTAIKENKILEEMNSKAGEKYFIFYNCSAPSSARLNELQHSSRDTFTDKEYAAFGLENRLTNCGHLTLKMAAFGLENLHTTINEGIYYSFCHAFVEFERQRKLQNSMHLKDINREDLYMAIITDV